MKINNRQVSEWSGSSQAISSMRWSTDSVRFSSRIVTRNGPHLLIKDLKLCKSGLFKMQPGRQSPIQDVAAVAPMSILQVSDPVWKQGMVWDAYKSGAWQRGNRTERRSSSGCGRSDVHSYDRKVVELKK